MKNDRMKKTEYLFREIGGIDDRYLSEAMFYRPRRSLPRVLVIAASLALCCALLLTLPLVARLTAGKDSALPPAVGGESSGNANSKLLEQDALLLSVRERLEDEATDDALGESITVLHDPRELPFFSGNAHVAWSYGDGSAIYVSPSLSAAQLTRLVKSIRGGTLVDTDDGQPACMIWITLGNGRVITPYLQQSNGNTGACELFDYHAEILPSSDFSSCLSDILQ